MGEDEKGDLSMTFARYLSNYSLPYFKDIRDDKHAAIDFFLSPGPAHEEDTSDREFIKGGYGLRHFSSFLRDDNDVVMAAVKNNGKALKYASDRLRDDYRVVRAAITSNGYAIIHASERLRGDKELVLMAIGSIIQSKRPRPEMSLVNHRYDFSAAQEAVREAFWVFDYLSDELKGDKDVALAGVELCWAYLANLPDNMKDDKDVALKALEQNREAWCFISERLKKDEDIRAMIGL